MKIHLPMTILAPGGGGGRRVVSKQRMIFIKHGLPPMRILERRPIGSQYERDGSVRSRHGHAFDGLHDAGLGAHPHMM